MKRGKVEWLCDSPQGFYILKELGQNTNTITNDDHTGVNRLPAEFRSWRVELG